MAINRIIVINKQALTAGILQSLCSCAGDVIRHSATCKGRLEANYGASDDESRTAIAKEFGLATDAPELIKAANLNDKLVEFSNVINAAPNDTTPMTRGDVATMFRNLVSQIGF